MGTATLGSCSKTLTPRAMCDLLPIRRLLIAYDTDQDGEAGAAKLAALSERMHRIQPPVGKDVTDFWQKGGRLRDWIAFHLARGGEVTA